MNTNFKTLKRKIVFLIFLPFMLFANAQINKDIKANSELLIPLTLEKQSFVRGSFKVENQVEFIDLLDENKKFVRKLDTRSRALGMFFFLTKNSSKYFLKVKNKNKKNKISFSIETIEAKYEKTVEDEIISPLIKKQKKQLETNKDTSLFWKMVEKKGTPFIEKFKNGKNLVTFLYKGAKHNVKLFSGLKAEDPNFKRLGDSDIWYKSFFIEKGAKIVYQLAPDVPYIKGTKREKKVAALATAQVDPFNKHPNKLSDSKKFDKYSISSIFEVENKNFIDWSIDRKNPKGTILHTKIESKILKNKRDIRIYTPYKFDYKQPHKLLFVFDGIDYIKQVNTPVFLDNLIFEKKILPTVAVFVDNVSRQSRSLELPPNKKFADFMAKELLHFVKTKVKFDYKVKNTILAGGSYGGLASMYVAFIHPETFGNVLSQSGSFWWSPKKDKESQWLTKEIAKSKVKDLNIYLNAGLYETGYLKMDILESNRNLRTVLKAKGYKNVYYKEFPSTHGYFSWRTNLADGLITLLKK